MCLQGCTPGENIVGSWAPLGASIFGGTAPIAAHPPRRRKIADARRRQQADAARRVAVAARDARALVQKLGEEQQADAAGKAEAEAARAAIDEVLHSESRSCGVQLCLHVSRL